MRKIAISVILLLYIPFCVMAQTSSNRSVTREEIIAQMNYYMYSLTTIMEEQSMSVLSNEIDILENNLRVKDAAKMDRTVTEYRKGLLVNLQDLKLSVEEQEVVNHVNAFKSSNAKWKALSNGLNQVLVLVPGAGGKAGVKQMAAQLAYQAILTAARTAVEYKTYKDEKQMEELQALWEFKKKKLDILNKQNVAAYELIQDLYRIYYGKLEEKDRLTKEDVKNFISIINEEDPKIRLERLTGSRNNKLQIMPEYWYYLGMTYIDLKKPEDGLYFLDKYIAMYNKAPIFYKDQKTGCVALAKLAYGQNLSVAQQRLYARTAIDNLPYNGSALIQCANAYLEIGDNKKAYSEIAEGINEPKLQDKSALVTYSSSLFPTIKNYRKEYSTLDYAITHCKDVSINCMIGYYVKRDGWSGLSAKNVITSVSTGEGADEDDDIWINTNTLYSFDFRELSMATILCEQGKYKILGRSLSLGKGIKLSQIEDKFPYFKEQKVEMYRFFTKLYGSDDRYSIKSGLNYDKIRKGEEQSAVFFESFSDPSKKRTEQKDAFRQCRKLAKFLEENADKPNKRANIVAKYDKKIDIKAFDTYAKVLSEKNHHNKEKNEEEYLVLFLKGELPCVLIYEKIKNDNDTSSFLLRYQGLSNTQFSAPWISLIPKAGIQPEPSMGDKLLQHGSNAVDFAKEKADGAIIWVKDIFIHNESVKNTDNSQTTKVAADKKEDIKQSNSTTSKSKSARNYSDSSKAEKSIWTKIYEKGKSIKESVIKNE